MDTARILHISDLHQGMGLQKVLMPAYRKALFDDFKELADISGSWGLVVFSGDLVQSGRREEYEALESFLQEVWGCFDKIGFNPILFSVPGNHDLSRPTSGSIGEKAFSHWWDGEDLSVHLFEGTGGYKETISSVFSGYVEWQRNSRIPQAGFKPGLLPGDASSSLDLGGVSVGVVGLNSAWLQLSAQDAKERLHVDARQLLGVCADPDSWADSHDLTLLVTHHPLDWLHERSRMQWRSEIDTHTRFDFHLHGHMHDHMITALQQGGGEIRRTLQASSLFGLEKVGVRQIERRHGYSLLSYSKGDGSPEVSLYPRVGVVIANGQHKLVPDQAVGIGRDHCLRIPVRQREGATRAPGSLTKIISDSIDSNVILGMRRSFPDAGAWGAVRKVERERAASILKSSRQLWLTADWGMGGDSFLSAIADDLAVGSVYYHVECDVWADLESIAGSIADACGASLEEICVALSSVPSAILLLDDISMPRSGRVASSQIKSVIDVVCDFCPDLVVVVRSRHSVPDPAIGEVALKLLDEIDGAAYIRAWRNGRYESLDEHSLESIFRHSGGSAYRMDSLLEDFEMFGVADLASLNPDLEFASDRELKGVSPVIENELIRIRDDAHFRRLFEMLSALAMFPKGETFESIRRFNGAKGFHAHDAKELRRLALLDVSEVATLAGQVDKVLFVPIPVRDVLLGLMSTGEFSRNGARALEAYFGVEWPTKGMSSSRVRIDAATCPGWKIVNASAMVNRAVRSAIQEGQSRAIATCSRLTYLYACALEKGDHFRSNVAFLEETLPVLRAAASKSECDELACLLAKSLRMSGRHEESLAVLSEVDTTGLTKASRQSFHYCIAECHSSLGNTDNARIHAKQAIEADPESGTALQSQALIVRLDGGSDRQVLSIEKKARKNKHGVLVRNILLDRAEKMEGEEAQKVLREVQYDARVGRDSYNCIRASVRLARLQLDSVGDVDDATFNILLEGYQGLHSDGSNLLFDRITNVLWDVFSVRGDLLNQISLFKHSSLRWRLRGGLGAESKYVGLLKSILERLSEQGMLERADVVYVASRLH
ncbi:metallophosphoesterase [Stenotrophomonas indicatrix]|uniref:metallophosphoesterase n=1 Tax=Stenotrophomonas indicatrix TaxID=2045451 RepID=UPI00215B2C28|nr:metallophosphoesterase [Stenotrophomonas indicatrix]MCR8714357.1 metallophosphoesterase [Stenotrophomonas indicatrix]